MEKTDEYFKFRSVIKKLQKAAATSGDLVQEAYKGEHPLAGFCYIMCEALYHLFPNRRLAPHRMKVGETSHWFLIDQLMHIVDPTADQFPEPLIYDQDKIVSCGFLTKEPSKRCVELIQRAGLHL